MRQLASGAGEQLSSLSRMSGIISVPRGSMFQHGVENRQPLAHAGGECHLRGFPNRPPSRIERREDGMVAHGRQGAHGPHRPDLRPSTPDRPFATPSATIAVNGGNPTQRGDLLAGQAPNAGTSATSVRERRGPTPGVLWRLAS
jgi:hypothetical protein